MSSLQQYHPQIIQKGEYLEIPGEETVSSLLSKNTSSQIGESSATGGAQGGFRNELSKNVMLETSTVSARDAYKRLSNDKTLISLYARNPAYGGTGQQTKGVKVRETPAEKLARLELELREFKEEMSYLMDSERQAKSELAQDDVTIVREIERLEGEVVRLAKADGAADILDTRTVANFSLEANLTLLKQSTQREITRTLEQKLVQQQLNIADEGQGQQSAAEAAAAAPGTEAKQPPSSQLTLFLDTRDKPAQAERFAKLEKRIATLESVLGEGSFEGGQPVLKKLDYLRDTVTLLNEQNLQEVSLKIAKLQADLTSVTEASTSKRSGQLRPEEVKKIEELWTRVQRVSGVAEELPLLVQRLESLKTLHEESAGFMNELRILLDLHAKIAAQLANNQTLLEKSEKTFQDNLKTVLDNVKLLEERVETIKK